MKLRVFIVFLLLDLFTGRSGIITIILETRLKSKPSAILVMCCPIRYLDKYSIVLLWCIILIAIIMVRFRIDHLTCVYICVFVANP